MSFQWKQTLLNESDALKSTEDKLINQTSYKYVISVIHLASLIRTRHQ